jgi:hypothetical protein
MHLDLRIIFEKSSDQYVVVGRGEIGFSSSLHGILLGVVL